MKPPSKEIKLQVHKISLH